MVHNPPMESAKELSEGWARGHRGRLPLFSGQGLALCEEWCLLPSPHSSPRHALNFVSAQEGAIHLVSTRPSSECQAGRRALGEMTGGRAGAPVCTGSGTLHCTPRRCAVGGTPWGSESKWPGALAPASTGFFPRSSPGGRSCTCKGPMARVGGQARRAREAGTPPPGAFGPREHWGLGRPSAQ